MCPYGYYRPKGKQFPKSDENTTEHLLGTWMKRRLKNIFQIFLLNKTKKVHGFLQKNMDSVAWNLKHRCVFFLPKKCFLYLIINNLLKTAFLRKKKIIRSGIVISFR